ncbi:MAG: hypothetical protein JF597_13635 [Streptomyces sp.]|nr:hypothetical protein [Streptomyces sp.]MBW8794598.1 hypothetical protein [Streptomyces sp.]
MNETNAGGVRRRSWLAQRNGLRLHEVPVDRTEGSTRVPAVEPMEYAS